MCYPVLIVSKSCPDDHIIEVTAAWRQCDKQADLSQHSHIWSELCWTITPLPDTFGDVPMIWRTDRQKASSQNTPCQACALFDHEADQHRLKQKLEELKNIESEYVQGLRDLEASVKRALKTLRGPPQATEIIALRRSERELRTLLTECQSKVAQVRQSFDRINEYYGGRQKDRLCNEALLPGRMYRLRYLAQATAEEKQKRPDYPRFQPKLEDAAEQFPLGIVSI